MKLARVAILSMMVSGSLTAQDVKIAGTVTKSAKLPVPPAVTGDQRVARMASNEVINIKFLNIQLSERAKQNFVKRAQTVLNRLQQPSLSQQTTSENGNSRVSLGMNDVPVLDQGAHGTCVTFANTAAVDAALNKGDYISQLCQLELGNYLEKNAYSTSGWDGSFGRIVLNQMDVYGVISKELQKSQGCGGLTEYPVHDGSIPEGFMNPEEYHQNSENLADRIAWTPVLDVVQAFSDRVDTEKTLNDVKLSLRAGDRVTFGVLLLDFDLGFLGAVGSHKTTYDTWVLTPEIARDVYLGGNFGGHEMVITGYDDNAIAVDEQGRKHRGLLTLRNSWGDNVGDHGDFYMSYDYFKLLVIEAQRIRSSDVAEG
ncbi:C1 family peptidase [Legionella jordanis]|uniref:Cysteine protease n=1 Tax=Legionella jordanis TaxID=456 RepID=A0A0W0VCW3_9GAMM|nr:C1 family peptidase [Legionella jordanis]KTD17985.1 cysteine protease [Legionella jordanis]RMX02325.1 peptidase C1 [Legionella jordanis]RMX15795.1 peptidase C1 [Legionella jordanis]VEH13923.1 cysteine protease, papain C1 family [Legionella jordanis]HAT8714303.1 peptidase C1 [Legionella jordanis]